MRTIPACEMCGRPTDGNTGIWIDDEFHPYCHPDEGPSCYEATAAATITFARWLRWLP